MYASHSHLEFEYIHQYEKSPLMIVGECKAINKINNRVYTVIYTYMLLKFDILTLMKQLTKAKFLDMNKKCEGVIWVLIFTLAV